VKPAKVSVYVKSWSTRVPARIEGVQFGFGQTCGAERDSAVLSERERTIPTEFEPTASAV
jgi:hypothetical protein